MLWSIAFVCVFAASTASARILALPVSARARRNLVSFASCDEYKTYFEGDAIDFGGAACDCSVDGSGNWVASCIYDCDICLESGCFILSYQRFSSGAEWECLDYSVQSPPAGKLCTLYDQSEMELAVAIDDEYCLPSAPNPICYTGYEYDCSNIGYPVVCNENDATDAIWKIAFDESDELCTVGICDEGRTASFPDPSSLSMAPETPSLTVVSSSINDKQPTSNGNIMSIGSEGSASKPTTFFVSGLFAFFVCVYGL